jgi:preprotein translocase subunit SecA
VIELIESRAREAYARREIEYPIDYQVTYDFGGVDGTTENPYASEDLHLWVLAKYRVDMPVQYIQSSSVRKLRQDLLKLQEPYFTGDKLKQEVDALVGEAGSDLGKLARLTNERYMTRLTDKDLEPQRLAELAEDADESADGQAPALTPRDFILKLARAFYRRELTQLEQFVLIQIFDQSWKDHLYAMDMLKAGIGLHSFAEQDPRILYKKEGFGFFQQMMAGIRDKVTDLIFRARFVGQPETPRSNYRETAAVHEDTGGYGVSENVRATADVAGEPAPSGGGAAEDGEGATKVKQIVNEAPKVGRNDPCPCGSGKKYKKCCGAGAA